MDVQPGDESGSRDVLTSFFRVRHAWDACLFVREGVRMDVVVKSNMLQKLTNNTSVVHKNIMG